jgi:hypothetical protein
MRFLMTDPVLTPEALDTIEARTNAATEGPWDSAHHYRPSEGQTYEDADWSTVGAEGKRIVATKEGWGTPHDVEFIAHAREDIPALVAELRRLRTENEEQRATITSIDQLAGEGAERILALAAERDALQRRIDIAMAVEDQHLDTAFYVIVGKMRAALTGEATT